MLKVTTVQSEKSLNKYGLVGRVWKPARCRRNTTVRLIKPRGSWNNVCTYETKESEQPNAAYQRETRNKSATEKETNQSAAMVHVRYVIGSQVASNAFISNFSMSQGSPEPQPTNYSSATFLDCDATESFLKKGQKAGA